MEKVIKTVIDNEEVLIKYRKSTGGQGHIVYSVETTIPQMSHFKFFIEKGKAGFIRTSPKDDFIKMKIMKLIDENELKK